jgi:hypothetical protein
MATQSQNKFRKRQKEMERMRKAKEKMARRQAKKLEQDQEIVPEQGNDDQKVESE